MRLLSRFALALITALGLVNPSGALAASTEWIMVTALPESNYLTQNVREFVKEINQKANGKLSITLHTNGELVKEASIRRAVQLGQVQVGEVDLGAHGNEDNMYVLDAIPGVVEDTDDAVKLYAAQENYFNTLMSSEGMKVLFPGYWPTQGFFTNTEINEPEDFVGKNMRVYSTLTSRLAELLGANPAVIPMAEMTQGFSTGLIDSAYTSMQTGIDYQIWDFLDYYYIMGGGAKTLVIVNQKAFNQLADDVQAIVLEAAANAETRGLAMRDKVIEAHKDRLQQNGVQVQQLPPSVHEKIAQVGETMMNDWRSNARSVEAAAVLDDFMSSK